MRRVGERKMGSMCVFEKDWDRNVEREVGCLCVFWVMGT